MLTVPLEAVPDLARELGSSMAGKIVLDTGNAYEGRDGDAARRAVEHPEGSAGWAASMFPGRPLGQGIQHGELQNAAERGTPRW